MGLRNAPRRGPLTLARYVLARNGVPPGARGSLPNMLERSLGASSFAGFWRFWNPIWGYYLGRFVFRPARRVLPPALALILTFAVSGALHDLAVTLVRGTQTFVLTPWFVLMSLGLLLGEALHMDLSARPRLVRASVHIAYIGACLWLARQCPL